MTTLNILLHTDERNQEETPKKIIQDKLLKFILISFIISWITLLPSCIIGFRTEGHDRHRVTSERGERYERHDDNVRHDNDKNRSHDEHHDNERDHDHDNDHK